MFFTADVVTAMNQTKQNKLRRQSEYQEWTQKVNYLTKSTSTGAKARAVLAAKMRLSQIATKENL